MRVLESKPIGVSVMGKKHKLRKQSRENVVRASDSSDDGATAGEIRVELGFFLYNAALVLYLLYI